MEYIYIYNSNFSNSRDPLSTTLRESNTGNHTTIRIISIIVRRGGYGYNTERPVTMDTAIRIDFSSLQGCTTVTLHAQNSRVAYTLLGNTRPKLSDTPHAILGSTERPTRRSKS